MARIFVYGTLQHPPLLRRLLGRVPDGVPATVGGHRAAPLDGRVYPGLLVEEGSVARGRVLEVTEDELDVLDRFEGPEYRRVAVRADTADGPVDAEAWLLVGATVHLAGAGSWDFERFVADDAETWLGGSNAGDHHPG